MFTTYSEALDFLYKNLPMFQRIGAAAMKPDLTNTIALCEILGNPQTKFKSIHVGGTNGKGSTSHMLASILQSSGYKTGLYTSPHLKEFTERIRVDGKEVSKPYVVDFVNRIKPAIEKIQPSFFEITVAMAFDYFVYQKVDVAVIEVGLGGRLDSTNVIAPVLSVITNIGWDHMDLLGDTLEKIAEEKAGIIKQNTPVVISERQPTVERVFKERAASVNASLYFASDDYLASKGQNPLTIEVTKNGKPDIQKVSLPLQGMYQLKNIIGVVKATELLKELGWRISESSMLSGFQNVIAQTGLKGRWQILNEKPLVVCDTGHNVDGITEVLKQIRQQSYKNLFMVFGMVKGKDTASVLALLPKDAYYFFCQPKIPRALEASLLREQAGRYQLRGEVRTDINDAIHCARQKATAEDMIFIGGSTFVVAEIENL
jgi:dihydrofolate synthase / folylpolyglutamate synthase